MRKFYLGENIIWLSTRFLLNPFGQSPCTPSHLGTPARHPLTDGDLHNRL